MPVQVGFQEGGGDLADTACSWPELTPSCSPPSRAKESFPSLRCLLARSHLLGEGPHLCLFPLWRRGEPRNQGILCSPRAVSQPRMHPGTGQKVLLFHLPVALGTHPSPAWQVVVYRYVLGFSFSSGPAPLTKEQLTTAFRLRDRGLPPPPTPLGPVLLFIPNRVL